MVTITNDFKRELKLTLENTESLYKLALSMADFDWQGGEVGDLYGLTVHQIKENGGKVEELSTDFDVREAHEVISSTARTLQEEAKA